MRPIGPIEEDNTQQQVKVTQTPTFEVEEEFDGTTVTLEPKEDEAKDFEKAKPNGKDVKDLSKQLKETATVAAKLQEQEQQIQLLTKHVEYMYEEAKGYAETIENLCCAIQDEGYDIWQCPNCRKIELLSSLQHKRDQTPLGWTLYPPLCPDCQGE